MLVLKKCRQQACLEWRSALMPFAPLVHSLRLPDWTYLDERFTFVRMERFYMKQFLDVMPEKLSNVMNKCVRRCIAVRFRFSAQ